MHLVVIFGPPAVGKMTIGRRVVERSQFRLFHNHAMIEPLLEVFDYGTPPFRRLIGALRQQVVEEAAAAGTDLVMTYVWGLEIPEDAEEIAQQISPYVDRGAAISFVELAAGLDTRLQRNRTEHRLAEKRSKRDVEWSDSNVREMQRHVMNTGGDQDADLPGLRLLRQHPHLRVDTSELAPEQSAERILAWLSG
ncbi:AAA family ATPase [Ornithinimicrobium faecis]|uniref:AAA family ATPase n=1 Tax=Ornithinimicrobium faecis TaxID=2934158 RepID=A0ABY4YUY0_9MICO|nr:AAA family ATPase [Ornithinimicrobium sp. HY1793]USQ80534.1 AAA family ATPase [Ornithinimicrobium sp. HY1793]